MRNIIIIIAIVVVIGSVVYLFNRNNNAPEELKEDIKVVDQVDDAPHVDGNSTGLYADYDPTLLAKADNGDVVLFFHAGWCPTCKALDRNLISELSNWPDDLTILKLNYDKESDLKKKYGVFIQHTLVQVDSQGNEITKWVGGNDLAFIIKRLK